MHRTLLCIQLHLYFCELFFFLLLLDEAKTTYTPDDVTTTLSRMPLMSLWTLFMNVFVLVEWVCWLSENGESVVLELVQQDPGIQELYLWQCQRVGASQSLRASFCIYTSVEMYLRYGMLVSFDFIDLPSPVGDLSDDTTCFWFLILQPPTGRARTYCSWYCQSLSEVHSSCFVPLILWHSRGGYDEVTA